MGWAAERAARPRKSPSAARGSGRWLAGGMGRVATCENGTGDRKVAIFLKKWEKVDGGGVMVKEVEQGKSISYILDFLPL